MLPTRLAAAALVGCGLGLSAAGAAEPPEGAVASFGGPRFRFSGEVRFVAYGPDGVLAGVSEDGTVRLFDADGKAEREFHTAGQPPTAFAVAPQAR